MQSINPYVLGIHPGARQIGVAVFNGEKLIFAGIKTIKTESNVKTLARIRRIITDLVAEYDIEHVALEQVIYVQQRRSFVTNIFDEVETFLKKRKVSYSVHDPQTVRRILSGDERPYKPNAALILAQRYPELRRYLYGSNIWQRRYSGHLFDAVAVGLAAVQKR